MKMIVFLSVLSVVSWGEEPKTSLDRDIDEKEKELKTTEPYIDDFGRKALDKMRKKETSTPNDFIKRKKIKIPTH